MAAGRFGQRRQAAMRWDSYTWVIVAERTRCRRFLHRLRSREIIQRAFLVTWNPTTSQHSIGLPAGIAVTPPDSFRDARLTRPNTLRRAGVGNRGSTPPNRLVACDIMLLSCSIASSSTIQPFAIHCGLPPRFPSRTMSCPTQVRVRMLHHNTTPVGNMQTRPML